MRRRGGHAGLRGADVRWAAATRERHTHRNREEGNLVSQRHIKMPPQLPTLSLLYGKF